MLNRELAIAAAVHGAIALACALWLLVPSDAILGVHPALKPLKFALSIALFLASMAALVPCLDVAPRPISVALIASLGLEMAVIGLQAMRGRRSHFNVAESSDATVVLLMVLGIAALTVTMLIITWVALARPLDAPPTTALAWRAALLFFGVTVISGAAMSARASHTVGGIDGEAGRAFTNWSKQHGDLRISHFVSLHALQILPLSALALRRIPLGGIALALVIAIMAAVTLWTLFGALAGRPV